MYCYLKFKKSEPFDKVDSCDTECSTVALFCSRSRSDISKITAGCKYYFISLDVN